MVKKSTKKVKGVKKKTSRKSNNEDSKFLAFIATFFSIFGVIIALIIRRDDKYVMFYTKQSIVLFILILTVALINDLVNVIPIIGGLINILLNFAVIVLWVLSWLYALSGEVKEVPFIGRYGKNIKL